MTCTGCHSLDGINEKMCMECPIRKCGQKQKLAHCAACKEYPCKHIKTYVPQAVKIETHWINCHNPNDVIKI